MSEPMKSQPTPTHAGATQSARSRAVSDSPRSSAVPSSGPRRTATAAPTAPVSLRPSISVPATRSSPPPALARSSTPPPPLVRRPSTPPPLPGSAHGSTPPPLPSLPVAPSLAAHAIVTASPPSPALDAATPEVKPAQEAVIDAARPALDTAAAEPPQAPSEIRALVKTTRESLVVLRGMLAELEGRLATLETALPRAELPPRSPREAASFTKASPLVAWLALARSALARWQDAWSKRYERAKPFLPPWRHG